MPFIFKKEYKEFYISFRQNTHWSNELKCFLSKRYIKRIDFVDYVFLMFVVDFIIINRDRHGANIEVLKTLKRKLLDYLFCLIIVCH